MFLLSGDDFSDKNTSSLFPEALMCYLVVFGKSNEPFRNAF